MTVCIAALCEKGKRIVVAADKMTVSGEGALQVLRDDQVCKIMPWQDWATILYSGSLAEPLVVFDKLKADADNGPKDLDELASRIGQLSCDWLAETRDGIVKNRVGDTASYSEIVKLVGTQMAGPLFEAWQEAKQYTPGTFLVAGFVKNRPASNGTIYTVSGARVAEMHLQHHAAIGSGGVYANAALDSLDYSRDVSLPESIFSVFCAKKSAENIYGVGRKTVMAMLTVDSEYMEFNASMLDTLEKVRLQKMKLSAKEESKIVANLSAGAS